MQLRRHSYSYKILKSLLLAGGFIVLSTVAPAGGAKLVNSLIKNYFRKKKFEKERFLRDLKRLQIRELIDYREMSDGKIEITLSHSGKKKILEYNIDDIKLEKNKQWDGQWRMVIFDIPHYKKQARDAFRSKLTELGFYPIQKSVFITPYECENEIDFICSIFDVRQHVLIFYINHFEGDKKLKYYFKI